MAGPLEYVRPVLFDEAVDQHHRLYVSTVLGRSPDDILKDRLGDQRGGSEWEPKKNLLEGD
jgi:hypothetical protein